MTILGNTANPTFGGNDTATWNEVAPQSNPLTSPTNLVVTKLWAYFGGLSGSVANCKLCIWGTGGTLIYASQAFTVGSGKAWRSVVPSPAPIIAAANAFYVGFFVPSGSSITFGIRSSGHWQAKSGVGSPASLSGSTQPGSPYIQGETGGYLEYVPAGVYFGLADTSAASMSSILSGASDGTPTAVSSIWVGAVDGTPVQIR